MQTIYIRSELTAAQRRRLARWVDAEDGVYRPGVTRAVCIGVGPWEGRAHDLARRLMTVIGRTFDYSVVSGPWSPIVHRAETGEQVRETGA